MAISDQKYISIIFLEYMKKTKKSQIIFCFGIRGNLKNVLGNLGPKCTKSSQFEGSIRSFLVFG